MLLLGKNKSLLKPEDAVPTSKGSMIDVNKTSPSSSAARFQAFKLPNITKTNMNTDSNPGTFQPDLTSEIPIVSKIKPGLLARRR